MYPLQARQVTDVQSFPSGETLLPAKNPRMRSCVMCQQRKIKCDQNEPCSSCVKARVDCVPAALIPPRRRKKRFPEAELLARLRHYEQLLRSYGAKIDSTEDSGEVVERDVDKLTTHDPAGISGRSAGHSTIMVKHSPNEEGANHVVNRGNSISTDKNNWTGLSNDLKAAEELLILQGSSEEDLVDSPIMSSFDKMFPADGGGLLFATEPSNPKLTNLHPQPVHIFRLWQTFLDSVNPLIKLFHAPSVQQQILDASGDLENVSRGIEALMFAIYTSAVMALSSADCQSLFCEEKEVLAARYQSAAQQALRNAGFLRSSDITVLQALVLYLLSIRKHVDPRSLFSLTGISVRSGQRIGLHRDMPEVGASNAPSAFNMEMRRRLWWEIVLLDSRVAELCGVDTSILTQIWATKQPLNVNDSDLYPDMRETPVQHTGGTEMLFCLIRCELAEFLKKSWFPQDSGCSWQELPISAKDKAIDGLEELLEEKYLKYCDPQVPLHFVSSTMARTSVLKLRLLVHHPQLLPDRGASMPQKEKDFLFSICLKMIEYHNLLLSNKGARHFFWWVMVNMPFHAFIYLLSELRHRGTQEIADQAWLQVTRAIEHHNVLKKNQDKSDEYSALQFAFASMTIRAWEAREAALERSPTQRRTVPLPNFLQEWRQQLAFLKSQPVVGRSRAAFLRTLESSGERRFGAQERSDHPEPTELGGSVDSSSLMPGSLSIESTMDWAYWNELMQDNDVQGGLDSYGQQSFFPE